MKKYMGKKIIAFLMLSAMVLSSVDMTAFADETVDEQKAMTEVAEDVPKELSIDGEDETEDTEIEGESSEAYQADLTEPQEELPILEETSEELLNDDNSDFTISDDGTLTLYTNYLATEVTIPDSVTKIASTAFAAHIALQTVNFSSEKNLTEIEPGAFSGCTSLTAISLPEGLTKIGANCFGNCTSLTSVYIPGTLEGVSSTTTSTDATNDLVSGPFKGCTSLTTVTWADGITKTPEGIFKDSSITEVTLPATVTQISKGTFEDAANLTTVNFSSDSELTGVGESAFSGCTSLTSITLPEKLTTIGASAFSGCTALTSITFPNTVKTIGKQAFYNCTGLTSLSLPAALTSIGESAFSGDTAIVVSGYLTIPKGVTTISASAFASCTGIAGYYFAPHASLVLVNDTAYEVKNVKIHESDSTLALKFSSDYTVTTEDCMWQLTEIKPATCTAEGYKDWNCAICGDEDTSTKVTTPKKQHTVPSYTLIYKKASEDEAGSAEGMCTTCNESVIMTVPKIEDVSLSQTSYTYDGSEKKPEAIITLADGKTLSSDNYTVTYSNNIKGTAKATIDLSKSKLYTGTFTRYFTIKQASSNTASVPTVDIENNSSVMPGVKLHLSSTTENATIYYTIDGTSPENSSTKGVYDDGIELTETIMNSSTRVVTIKAYTVKSGMTSSQVQTFTYTLIDESTYVGDVTTDDMTSAGIDSISDIPTGFWVANVVDSDYTGSPITFSGLKVFYGKKLLKVNTDYTVKYSNNTNAAKSTDSKAPTVTVTGKGNYTGKLVKTFTINQISLRSSSVSAAPIYVSTSSENKNGTTVVTWNSKVLKANKDYTYDYDGVGFTTNEREYSVVIKGKGNFMDSITVTEYVTAKNLISKATIKNIPDQTFENGKKSEPEVTVIYKGKTLTKTTDYNLSYSGSNAIGTATVTITGVGDYAGTKTASYKIVGTNLRKATIKNFNTSVIYTGSEITQDSAEVHMKISGTDTTLVKGTDYTVSYDKNTSVGAATAIFTGIGNYSGTIKKTFKIKSYDLAKDENTRITVTFSSSIVYAKGGACPIPTVVYAKPNASGSSSTSVTLSPGTDYVVSYLNNKAVNENSGSGKAPTIIITGKGNYSGKRNCGTFAITSQNISNTKILVPDKAYQEKGNIYNSKPTITDLDGKILSSGKDYDSSLIYQYAEAVSVTQKGSTTSVDRAENDIIDKNDIIPIGTELKVTAKGKGNYSGEITGYYRISYYDISKATVSVPDQYFTGNAITVEKSDVSIRLKVGKHYVTPTYEIVSFSNNTSKGTATMTLRGTGMYGGIKNVKFKILNSNMSYAVQFIANGGTGTMKNQLISKSSEKLNMNKYKKDSVSFTGWNTKPDGTGTSYTDGESVKAVSGGVLKLYAQWK